MLSAAAAGAARRLLRPRPAGAARRAAHRAMSGCASSTGAPPSCASWPAPATGSSTCSRSSCPRSRPRRPRRPSRPPWAPSAIGCATRRSCVARRHRGGARPHARRPAWGRPSCWPTRPAQLEHVAAVDPRLEPLAERLEALRYESEDVAAELRGYLGRARQRRRCGAGRLEEVEERLALLARLERKHGGTIADVLAHADRCRERRDELENADSALEALEAELAQARAERDALAGRLGKARRSHGAQAGRGRARRAWPSWPWPMRASRSSCRRAPTAADRAAPTPSRC